MTIILRVLGVILIWTEAKAQSQPAFTQTTTLGATLNINCQVYSGSRTLVWYKLDTDRRLQMMASANNRKGQTLYGDDRYLVQSSEGSNTLSVSNVTWEDAGIYYCGVINEYDVMFGTGTEVVVEGKVKPPPSSLPSVPPSLLQSVPPSLLQSVLQSPDYIRVQPGDSVTLSCLFNTSYCTKEHISVRWKQKNFASKIISWSNETKNIICKKQTSTERTSCVHNLTLIATDLSSAEDETYLCEVTACGHTLQGCGTKVHLHNGDPCTRSFDVFGLSPTVIALMGLNIALGVFVLVLMLVVCSNNKKQHPDIVRGANQDIKAEDEIMYARVNVGPIRATQETPDEEASLYSQVKIRPKDRASHK